MVTGALTTQLPPRSREEDASSSNPHLNAECGGGSTLKHEESPHSCSLRQIVVSQASSRPNTSCGKEGGRQPHLMPTDRNRRDSRRARAGSHTDVGHHARPG